MEAYDEKTADFIDDGPMTQRCVYVQDRDSQRWLARVQGPSDDARSAEELR